MITLALILAGTILGVTGLCWRGTLAYHRMELQHAETRLALSPGSTAHDEAIAAAKLILEDRPNTLSGSEVDWVGRAVRRLNAVKPG